MRAGSGYWGLGCCLLLALPLRAEVKVIPVFEADAAVQTLKEIYPDLGVSAMGNQLVLSGTPAQLQEAERTLAQVNQPPQSLLIEWRVDGASSSQQAGVGLGLDAKRQWLLEGDARHYERSQSDNWQVRGLSGRPVLLQMGSYQPVTFYQWQGGRVVGMMPLMNGLYATATLIGDRGSFPQPKAAGRPRSPIHQAWAGPAAANARLCRSGSRASEPACQWG